MSHPIDLLAEFTDQIQAEEPKRDQPGDARAFFSSLHSDDTRKQMPEMAKEQERRRIHLDEAGRIEFIGIAKQPSASGKSGQRCNRQDEKETACHHKTLRERHFPSGGRGGQQIGHRALIYQLGHQLGRQLHADDRQDEHQNQSVVFPEMNASAVPKPLSPKALPTPSGIDATKSSMALVFWRCWDITRT